MQFVAFAAAEACCDAQAFEVFVDYLAAQADSIFGEECFYFFFAIQQRDYRLAHPGQRGVGKLANHLLPVLLHELPRLVAAGCIEQQGVHQVGRVLGAHFAVEGELKGPFK